MDSCKTPLTPAAQPGMLHGICIQSVRHSAILALIIPRFYIRNLHFNKSIAIFASSPRVTRGMLKGAEETAGGHGGESHFPDGNHRSQTWLWGFAGLCPPPAAVPPPLQALSICARNLSGEGERLWDVSREVWSSPCSNDPGREGAPKHHSPPGWDLPAHNTGKV